MKKLKKLFLLPIIGISVFLFGNIENIKAANLTFSNKTVVCEKDLEVGESTFCYLIGKGNSEGAAHGFVTKVYTRDGLRLVDATSSSYPPGTNKLSAVATSNGEGVDSGSDGIITNFICSAADDAALNNPNHAYNSNKGDFMCMAFYSTTKEDKKFTVANAGVKASDKNTILEERVNSANLVTPMVIGKYGVELRDNPDNGCGEICVKEWVIDESTGYDNYTKGPDSPGVGAGGDYFCVEVHLTPKDETGNDETPETGSFISYTLLIAGALIAIGAIVIANKNNKVYHV